MVFLENTGKGLGWRGAQGGGMDFDMHSTSGFVQNTVCTVTWLSFCRYHNNHSQSLASPQIHFFGLWVLVSREVPSSS